MDFGDLLLTPVFIILLYFIFRANRNKFTDPVLKKYHRQAFWVKMIAAVFFIIFYGILSGGDSFNLYHTEGRNLYNLILKDVQNLEYLFKPGEQFDLTLIKNPYNAGYFESEANFMMIRLDALFSFVTMGRYAPVNLLFAAIGFSGIWKLFLFFYEQFPQMHKKFAIAILFFPTVVFWSSGLLKDTLCIASLGWITYSMYDLFFRKRHLIKNLFIIILFSYLLFIIKVYILLAYFPFLVLFLVLKNVNGLKTRLVKWVAAPLFLLFIIWGFSNLLSNFEDELGVYAVEEVTTSIITLNNGLAQKSGQEDAASNFNLGAEFDGSVPGLLKIAPYAISATFFRPFIWEASKMTQLLAAIESMVLLFFTLFILIKTGPFRLIKIIFKDSMIMYCLLFALVFGLFVGASTINFGTLVRYKIPSLPFFTIALFLIYERVKETALSKKLAKETEMGTSNILFSPALA